MRRLQLLLPAALLIGSPDARATGDPLIAAGAATTALERLAAPGAERPDWLARGRGGGGGRHQSGGHRARTGMGGRGGGLERGSRRPSGGWSQRLGDGDRGRRGLNREAWDRGRSGDRRSGLNREQIRSSLRDIDRSRIQDRSQGFNRGEWDRARRRWEDQGNRQRDRWQERRDRWDDHWHDHWPGWVRPGWGLARPWRWGWYGTRLYPTWGWWGARSALWGIGTLATAAGINEAVDDAIAAGRPTIVVPSSDWTLHFNSVQPISDTAIRFTAGQDGSPVGMTADCRSGDLNGAPPTTAAAAQLLHAACQVAFGGEEGEGDGTPEPADRR